MATGQLNRVVGYLRRATLLHELGRPTDGQLLESFLTYHDEAAFAALMQRHGPMVLGVCRRVLANGHDAEDAFQATFLVLVRQAASIWPRDLVANWLYGVARRTALKARTAAARRRRVERQAGQRSEREEGGAGEAAELRALLDEELQRLPDKYRAPLVLCFLEGKPRKEAARQLGWSEGTLSGRLARAKTMLAARLTRRGLALSAGALTLVTVPPTLMAATVKAALPLASGQLVTGIVSAQVVALMEEVAKAMLMTKFKIVAGVLLVMAGIGFGTAGLGWQAWATADEPQTAVEVRPTDVRAALAKPKAPYIIEPPDILSVDYFIAGQAHTSIKGQHNVRPDGTIALAFGDVSVAGMTADDAREAIARHLAKRVADFNANSLEVKVVESQGKVCYVIWDTDQGDYMCRVPFTGNERVLDVVRETKPPLAGLAKRHVWVSRPKQPDGNEQSLLVDWRAILEEGALKTNYELLPGDRIFLRTKLRSVPPRPANDKVLSPGYDRQDVPSAPFLPPGKTNDETPSGPLKGPRQ